MQIKTILLLGFLVTIAAVHAGCRRMIVVETVKPVSPQLKRPEQRIQLRQPAERGYPALPPKTQEPHPAPASPELISRKPAFRDPAFTVKRTRKLSYEEYCIAAEDARRIGDLHKAIAMYRRALTVRYPSYALYIKLGDLYSQVEDKEKALEMYKQALRLLVE